MVTWGAAEFGERGNGESGFEPQVTDTPRSYAMFVPGLKHIVAVAASSTSDYALREEDGRTTLYSWGRNSYGKLGIGTTSGPTKCKGENNIEAACATVPQEVDLPSLPEGVKVTAIASDTEGAYALLSNGMILSWGSNSKGQLGVGPEPDVTAVPVYVCAVGATPPCGSDSYLHGITAIAAGTKHALALTEGGEVVGWGDNAYGALTGISSEQCRGTKETACQLVPRKVSGLEEVTAISAGDEYSLALVSGAHL